MIYAISCLYFGMGVNVSNFVSNGDSYAVRDVFDATCHFSGNVVFLELFVLSNPRRNANYFAVATRGDERCAAI